MLHENATPEQAKYIREETAALTKALTKVSTAIAYKMTPEQGMAYPSIVLMALTHSMLGLIRALEATGSPDTAKFYRAQIIKAMMNDTSELQ